MSRSWQVSTLSALIGMIGHSLAEFFREIAALVLVFFPLDWWLPRYLDKGAGPNFLWHVLEASVALLALSLFSECVALVANRAKRDLEGNHGE